MARPMTSSRWSWKTCSHSKPSSRPSRSTTWPSRHSCMHSIQEQDLARPSCMHIMQEQDLARPSCCTPNRNKACSVSWEYDPNLIYHLRALINLVALKWTKFILIGSQIKFQISNVEPEHHGQLGGIDRVSGFASSSRNTSEINQVFG